jgi:hypothetical protein
MKRLFLLTLLSGVLLSLFTTPIQSQDNYLRSPHLGISHISAPSDPIVDQRYRNALFLGAGWNRWALYWDSVEQNGNFNWGAYDATVANDVSYGLRTDAILLGIPANYRDGGSISGLNESVFSDGTDSPAIGKQPNPNNPYARFVYEAVMRYKPGGTLGTQMGWSLNQGVRVWEAWNEPDLRMFWGGTVGDYYRLLKVTYLIVRVADPLAQVMMAGMAYNNPDVYDYLAQTLGYIAKDPQRDAYNWYFDIAAVHSYSNAERSGRQVSRMKQVLRHYGLDRPVWLNESGAPVWDDYPGPTWTGNSPSGRQYRVTQEEQALYVIQSTVLAWQAGADVVFIFQLYDDCGNQPSGTNFPPNSGQAGDAYGLFRNDRSSVCFSQSTQPNSPRPAAAAFYRIAQIFGNRNIQGSAKIDLRGRGRVLAFDLSPQQGVANFGPVTDGGGGSNVVERAYVMWNHSSARLPVEVPASGSSAQLYDMGSDDYQLSPQDGKYIIGLPPVSRDDYPGLPLAEIAQISGDPFILIEQVQPGAPPLNTDLVRVNGDTTEIVDLPTASPIVINTIPPTAIPTPIPQPTVDPALDTQPPVPVVLPLASTSPSTFTVQWDAVDDSGIAGYIVWVRVNGGNWEKWLQTTSDEKQANYVGAPGSTYEFSLWAVDLGGNWSENIELAPLATTTVQ